MWCFPAHYSRSGQYVPAINCLEVRAEYVRIAGPAWEDYFIYVGE